jgi:Arc/MetJ-type ribon-helix-helix transcriptional regulator
MTARPDKFVTVRFNGELLEDMERLQDEVGVSASELIRRSVRMYLDALGRPTGKRKIKSDNVTLEHRGSR